MKAHAAVYLPAWAVTTIAPLLEGAFTGSFTCNFNQGHLSSVEYLDGRCPCCGQHKKVRVTPTTKA